MSSDIDEQLRSINAKLDKLIDGIEELRGKKRSQLNAKKARKEKLAPLTQEDIDAHQTLFAELFERWRNGEELDVQTRLEQFDVDQLRRFADANNLNVTSKMSAQKVLQLIAARFREKRQLLSGMVRKVE